MSTEIRFAPWGSGAERRKAPIELKISPAAMVRFHRAQDGWHWFRLFERRDEPASERAPRFSWA